MNEETKKELAKDIVLHCFRNSVLENLHSGISPSSKKGDYSDVKVVTPYGEIAWNEVSRFNDEEMKELMIDVVDKTYTFLKGMFDDAFSKECAQWISMMRSSHASWNEPKITKGFLKKEYEDNSKN